MGLSTPVQLQCTRGAKLEFQITRLTSGQLLDLTGATVRVAFAEDIGRPTVLSASTDDGRITVIDGIAAVAIPAFATEPLTANVNHIGMVWITYPGQETLGPERPVELRLMVKDKVF